eukprot:Nk52_evm32s147 gene=Nk52_evmTU32s147
MKTSYKPFKNKWNWGEWLVLPLKYKDLSRCAQIGFTVWDLHPPNRTVPIGGATLSLFDDLGALQKGRHKLHLWEGRAASLGKSASTGGNNNSLLVGSSNDTGGEDENPGTGGGEQIMPTPGVRADSEGGEMDRLEKIMKNFNGGAVKKCEWLDKAVYREIEKINQREKNSSKKMLLFVEFPQFDHTVVFHEKGFTGTPLDMEKRFISIADPDLLMENLAEQKHRNLARSYRRGAHDKDLKPNPKFRDNLFQIMNYPPTKILTADEKDLLWKFRFFLSGQKKGLTKFLKCVEWNNVHEAKQATDMLALWEAIDVDDALELLSGSFTNVNVRKYAVSRLEKADDEELLLYLLQLVQALRYDHRPASTFSGGADLGSSSSYAGVGRGSASPAEHLRDDIGSMMIGKQSSSLADFLMSRAVSNAKLCNFFYWYLMVECEGPNEKINQMYRTVKDNFIQALARTEEGEKLRSGLEKQSELIGILCSLATDIKSLKDREKRTTRLRHTLKKHPLEISCPLPLDPLKTFVGINYHNVFVMKSSLMPMRLPLQTEGGSEYTALFKTGDDLRQDQLIVQIVALMDRLLLKENLDLKLTPYQVLATGTDCGLVEFVDARPVAQVLANHQSIQAFFRACFPANNPPYGIENEVMDTYIKSCAGYCVITYILGVGDRHLDNLLLSSKGRLFHIDFGYILGRDPKPFPPPMKISKEMVEAMGGTNSPEYKKFVSYGYTAFLILRKNANLILNLLSLMVDANIPDIALEPDRAVLKVQEKFVLDMSDDEVHKHYQAVVDDSVGALFPQMVEQIHKWAQYWRK